MKTVIKDKNEQLLQSILTKVEKKFSKIVDLIGVYGSFARGENDRFSDLNIVIITSEETDEKLDYSFIVDDGVETGYRLRSITWDEYFEIALTVNAGEILQLKPMYFASNYAKEKYIKVKRIAEENYLSPLDYAKLQKIKPVVDEMKIANSDVQTSLKGQAKFNALKLTLKAIEILMSINCAYYKYGLTERNKDVEMLTIIPKKFMEEYKISVLESDEEKLKKNALNMTVGVCELYEKLNAVYSTKEKTSLQADAYERIMADVNSKFIRSQISADKEKSVWTGYVLCRDAVMLKQTCDLALPPITSDYFNADKLPFIIKKVKDELNASYSGSGLEIKKYATASEAIKNAKFIKRGES